MISLDIKPLYLHSTSLLVRSYTTTLGSVLSCIRLVSNALCQLIGTLAKHELGGAGWQELPQFVLVIILTDL